MYCIISAIAGEILSRHVKETTADKAYDDWVSLRGEGNLQPPQIWRGEGACPKVGKCVDTDSNDWVHWLD